MEILNYFLALIAVYLGLILGFFVSWSSKEELSKGKRYFIFFGNIIFSLSLFFGIVIYNELAAIIVLVLVFILLNNKKIIRFIGGRKDLIAYILFSILFYLSSRIENLFIIQSCLIFLYGFFASSVIFEENIKNKKKRILFEIIKKTFVFVVLANILFLVLEFLKL